MRYIEWEIENYPDRYSHLRCNQVLDMQTLAHVIGNIDRPDGVKWEDFKKVLNEVAETINIVPAVDTVEVTRCKDCAHLDKRQALPDGYPQDCHWCTWHSCLVSPDGFCHYGVTAEQRAAEQDAYEQLCNLGNPEDGSL